MANGVPPITDLVRHRSYQDDLLALMTSLTEEGPAGAMRAAKTDSEAFDAIVAFRRRWRMAVLDDDPNCQPLYYVAGLHRAIIRHRYFVAAARGVGPDALKARGIINYSEHWLIRQGYGTDVDTEFNPKPLPAVKLDDAASRLDTAREPGWRDDPTYNLRRKKPRRPR